MLTLKYAKQNKEFQAQENAKFIIGFGDECEFCIPNVPSVARAHVLLLYDKESSRWIFKNLSKIDVLVSGVVFKKDCGQQLGSSGYFCFGEMGTPGSVIVSYRNENYVQDVPAENRRFVKLIKGNEAFWAEIIKMITDYYIGFDETRIFQHTTKFFCDTFNLDTAVIYYKHGKHGNDWSIKTHIPEENLVKPSKTLLAECVKENKPIHFVFDDQKDYSQSIITKKIKSAFIFPIDASLVLYFDSKEEVKIREKESYIISQFLNLGLKQILKRNSEKEEIGLTQKELKSIHNLPVRICIFKKNYSIFASVLENRLVFGVGNIQKKNFVDGLLRGSELIKDEIELMNITQEQQNFDISILQFHEKNSFVLRTNMHSAYLVKTNELKKITSGNLAISLQEEQALIISANPILGIELAQNSEKNANDLIAHLKAYVGDFLYVGFRAS